MKINQNVADLVGKTPMIRLNKCDHELFGEIYAKCEFKNPSGSIKDRIALGMLQGAIKDQLIDTNTHIIEPTSGNTGIGLASLCASMGLKLTLVMPASMSLERRALMSAFGAHIELTPSELGMNGAVKKAHELQSLTPNSIILNQFANPNNPLTHEHTTALEIFDAMDGEIDIFIAGVGTGGTLSGVGKLLKSKIPSVKIIAIEPSSSAILSGNPPAPHKIQGIGAGFIPATLNQNIYDEILTISDTDAIKTANLLAKKEGILVGISSGANIYGAIMVAKKEENKGKKIVTILCDSGERYLSLGIYGDNE